ncbi:CubicO group peptidase (beta-lactamase class C family) [Lipingzhangella halophila]|uniref:CubicO group peptidase (Beta-lactamase class C family) n=1 Tax=Lipingzhangella halophila TaxID=1783352 RepID=A0A7W7W3U7_9ACTN|nr:serine hydrolase domain-containing protein [Lipingzhangella halophila]MBB4932908.1 CubicO group peptidase (beta-lactamase class C family) [Lipingzhangella halophila]
MTRWIRGAGASLLTTLLLGCAMAGPAAGADKRERPVATGEIDGFVEDYIDTQGLAGVSVALLRDGEILYTKGYGHDSSGGAVTADTPMMLASLSKSMTAMGVMRMVEEGEVELDDPVRDYLPEFDPADRRAERITVRQLLDQTSGMSSSGLVSPDRQAKGSLKEAVAILESMELTAEPGTRFQYFNGNYWMLARMIESVSGEPFGAYLDDAVFSPLGMEDSTTFENAGRAVSETDGLQSGHTSAYGTAVARQEPADFVVGAGSVVSTAADMARWLAPYTSGGRTAEGEPFVSAATIDAMLTPSDPAGEYALGWRDGTPDGSDRPRMSHGGTQLSYSAYQGIYHDREYAVAVLNNSFTLPLETAYPIAEGVIDIVEGKAPEESVPVNAISDYVLAALTVLTAALGTRRLVRAPEWAERLSGRSTLRLTARLSPRMLPFALVCGFIALAAANGADASLLWIWFAWPALGVWALAGVVFNLATVAVRAGFLRRSRSRRAALPHQP